MAMALEKRDDSVYAIGSFQAKTYFAELLRSVESGASVIITRNGHDIAVLEGTRHRNDEKSLNALARFKKIAVEIAEGQKTSGTPITVDEIMSLRDEGRKY